MRRNGATEFLLEEVGDGLLAVVIVQSDGFEVTYLDEALIKRFSRDSFSTVIDTFRLERPFLDLEIDDYPVGERRAIVLQFPFSETETILISISHEMGRDLLGFIEECRQMVHGEEAG